MQEGYRHIGGTTLPRTPLHAFRTIKVLYSACRAALDIMDMLERACSRSVAFVLRGSVQSVSSGLGFFERAICLYHTRVPAA